MINFPISKKKKKPPTIMLRWFIVQNWKKINCQEYKFLILQHYKCTVRTEYIESWIEWHYCSQVVNNRRRYKASQIQLHAGRILCGRFIRCELRCWSSMNHSWILLWRCTNKRRIEVRAFGRKRARSQIWFLPQHVVPDVPQMAVCATGLYPQHYSSNEAEESRPRPDEEAKV